MLGAFTFWPLLQTLLLSFQTWNLNPDVPSRFVGFDNYRGVVSSSLFGAALANTALYLLAAIPLKVILPLRSRSSSGRWDGAVKPTGSSSFCRH